MLSVYLDCASLRLLIRLNYLKNNVLIWHSIDVEIVTPIVSLSAYSNSGIELLFQNCACILPFICLCFMTVNRRLDEWVKLEQLDLNSVEAVVDEKVEDKVMILWYRLLLTLCPFFNVWLCVMRIPLFIFGYFFWMKPSFSFLCLAHLTCFSYILFSYFYYWLQKLCMSFARLQAWKWHATRSERLMRLM